MFPQGSRLHSHLKGSDSRHFSTGDGAWIMQQSAKSLGGHCDIRFHKTETIFTIRCPVEVVKVADWPDAQAFEVPEGTWGIAIDDSRVQRKMLSRILTHSGVEESRLSVLGKDYADTKSFEELLLRLVKENPGDKLLVLVDENLDFRGDDGKQVVLSGSLITEAILKEMTPSQESRVLALVRSANDSAEDMAVYCKRTHGFFPKAPVNRDRVREVLASLWKNRFHGSGST